MACDMRRRLRKFLFFVGEGAWRVDIDSLGFFRRIWVNIVRFLSVSVGGFIKNRCALYAAGLTYFSLLALVPALCLLMVLAKTCGAGDFARTQINGYFDRFIASVEEGAQPAAGAGQTRTPAEEAAEEKRIAQHAVAVQLREFVNPLFDQIDKFDIRAFGWVGFAMLMWTIISSLGQIESTMNAIWNVSRQRHFLKRCWLYLFVVSVVPLLSAVALSLPVLRLVKRALDATMGATVYTKWVSDALVAVLDSRLFSFVVAAVCVTLLFAFVHAQPACAASRVAGGGLPDGGAVLHLDTPLHGRADWHRQVVGLLRLVRLADDCPGLALHELADHPTWRQHDTCVSVRS